MDPSKCPNATTAGASQSPEHTVELGGAVVKENGMTVKGDVGYATAKNTSGNGELGGQVGVGGSKFTVTFTGGSTKGQVEGQQFTADLNGHIGKSGLGAGANARALEWGGQLSFKLGSSTVMLNGTVSALGVGANGHADWNHGFSAGGGAILLLGGASLDVSVTGGK